MHVTKGAAALIIAIMAFGSFGVATTSAGAAAGPTLSCTRGVNKKTGKPNVGQASRGGVCSLHFQDATFSKGLKVCFATAAPNIVKAIDASGKVGKPTKTGCTVTSHGGGAHGLFEPRAKGTFTVTATETLANGSTATASTSIVVKK